jgi:hypothetical protein
LARDSSGKSLFPGKDIPISLTALPRKTGASPVSLFIRTSNLLIPLPNLQSLRPLSALIDERSVSRFEPAGIAAILRSHGFCAIEDINFQEIASRFGRAVQGLAPGHAGVHVVHAKH